MKSRWWLEIDVYVLYAVALLSGLIAIADLFGFLDRVGLPALAERVPILTLLVLSLVSELMPQIRRRLDNNEQRTRELISSIQAETTERILALRKQINPSLEAVFGDQITDLLTKLTDAVRDQRFTVYDVDLFRYFFKRTLEAFPHGTFLASSLPYQKYFWKNPPMEEAMARFIVGGGKMKRVFFIYNTEELNKSEVKEILRSQVGMGVEVYITYAKNIPTHLRRLAMLETEERIAWEVHIGPDGRITSVVATSDPEPIAVYRRMYRELFELAETQLYRER